MSTETSAQHERRVALAVAIALVALTIGVFWPLANYRFVAFDDNDYVYQNPLVMNGLTTSGIVDAFTTTVSAHWHPLTMLSLMADATLYGDQAGGYHVTNLILHIVNVLLLFALLRTMTGALWPAAIVAALFAVHPINVEPVAWISSRKDLLSATFLFLAVAAYTRYTRNPSTGRFSLVLLCMLAGLLSKSIVIVLPALLFLLDAWPLRRVGVVPTRQIVLEKFALVPLSLLFVLINATAQHDAGQVGAMTQFSFIDRIANSAVAYATYLGQTIWPVNLAMYYPLPAEGYPASTVLLSFALLIGITLATIALARNHPAVMVGWCWFLGVLAPVIGIVQLGAQAHADRYMYLPLIGLSIAVVWPLWSLARRRGHAIWPAAFAAIPIVAFASVSALDVPHWRDSEAAFKRALAVTGDNYLMHYNYGAALQSHGRLPEAILQYQAALEINPLHAESHNNVGALRSHYGQFGQAMAHFNAALQVDPDNAVVLCNLAMALTDLGRPEEALESAKHAARIAPDAMRTKETMQIVLAANNIETVQELESE